MTPSGPQRRIWLAYALWVLVAGAASAFAPRAGAPGSFPARLGPLVGASIVCLGLFAWLGGRPVGRPWMWSAVSWLLALGAAAALGWGLRLATDGAGWPAAWRIAAGLTALPGAIALHRYALRSPALWPGGAASASSSSSRRLRHRPPP